MILDNTKIRELSLIHNADESLFRAASYDLTIDSIVTAEGQVVTEHALAPQGIVKVTSREIVEMPADVTGYVHVKTALCNEGILTLNIGIVDPCFNGPLQSTVLNFGKNIHRLRKGAVFGRITFHKQCGIGKDTIAVVRSSTEVLHDAQSHMDQYLASDFLNFAKTVESAANEAANKYKNTLLVLVPVFAIMLAVFTFLLNFANMSRLEGYINVGDRASDLKDKQAMTATLSELKEKDEALAAELKMLRIQVQANSGKDRQLRPSH